jgi:lactoylglutathione lyase
MKIDHLALWVADLEAMKDFYTRYFGATAGDRYHNPHKNFSSYFLSFTEGCRLELMHRPDIDRQSAATGSDRMGLIHFAIGVGSREAVDALTQKLAAAGYTVKGQPRTTGDGYYESLVLDPENNLVEITI